MKTLFLRTSFLGIMIALSLGLFAQNKTKLSVQGCQVQQAKTYDALLDAYVIYPGELTGFIDPSHSVDLDVEAYYDNANVGDNHTITVTFSISGTDAKYYDDPDPLILTGCSISQRKLNIKTNQKYNQTKIYDGNTSVVVSSEAILGGIQESDQVFVTTTMNYSDKNVGNQKTVNATYTIYGADAYNYLAPNSKTFRADITSCEIHISGTRIAPSKVYDGSFTCEVTDSGAFDKTIPATDDLSFIPKARYTEKNVDNGIAVYVTYNLIGNDVNNYLLLTDSVKLSANITKRQLTASTSVYQSKQYDENIFAKYEFYQESVRNKVPSDTDIIVTPYVTYDNPEVGTNKTMTVTYTHYGTNPDNYLSPVDSLIYTGIITKRSTSVTNTNVPGTKEYDGTDTAHVVNPGTLSPTSILGNDTVYLIAEAHYNDSSAGDNKYITITYRFIGPDSAKYEPPHDTVIPNCVIIPKTLKIGTPAKVVDSKVYDGYTDISIAQQATIANPIGDDEVSLVGEAHFDNSRVGTDKRVTISYIVTGPAAANYSAPNATLDTADITPLRLTIQPPIVQDSKEYDGLTDCNVIATGSLTNTIGTDTVYVRATANYDNKNVGSNKDVYVTYSLNGGAQSRNYEAPLADTVHNKSITQKKAIVTGTVLNPTKEYDGTDSAKVNLHGTVSNANGDTVWVVAHAVYDDKNVGNGKNVTIVYTLEGPDAGNYSIPDNSYTTANITKKYIYISTSNPATVDTSKVYDGNRRCNVTSSGTIRPGDVVPGDVVAPFATAEYLDSTAGTNKTVIIYYSLTGKDKDNYAFAQSSGYTRASIDKLQLTAVLTDISPSKVYDGNVVANVKFKGQLNGVLAIDSLVSFNVAALYDSATVGVGKTITVNYELTGIGKDNYITPVPYTRLGDITKASVYVKGTKASEKDYDGNTSVVIDSLGTLIGMFDSDVYFVIDTLNTHYSDPNADFHKPITVSYTLMGSANKNNYNALPSNTIYADILPKQLYATSTKLENPKIYDGGVNVNVTDPGMLRGVVGTDNVTLSATAVTANATAGNNKSVTITYSISGNDAGNYLDPDVNQTEKVTILQADLTVTGTKVDTIKGFDGTTTARISEIGTLEGKKGSDNISITATANYNDANVGTGKTITVNYKVVGSDSINYNTPAPTVFNNGVITLVQPTVVNTVCETTKVYDGNTTVVVTNPGELVGVDPADTADVRVSATAVYDDDDASQNRKIYITYTLSGSKAGNYGTPSPKTITGVITPRGVSAYGAVLQPSRVYDATTNAQVINNGSLTQEALASDSVYPVATAVFKDKNAGLNKCAYVYYTLDGKDKNNYYLKNTSDSALASISRAPLTIGGTGIQFSKNYDGNRQALVISPGTFIDAKSGDDLNLSAEALYDTKYAGTNKTITVSYTVTGRDSANYINPAQKYFTNGEITAVKPTVSGYQVKTQKVYDGYTTVDTIYNVGTLAGVDPTLDVHVNAVANYEDKNEGSNKDITITFSLYGQDAKNFTTPDPVTLVGAGTITPKPVIASNAKVLPYKTYDGTINAIVTDSGRIAGIISPDTVILVATASYRDKNVDTTKIVDVRYSLTGLHAHNYTLNNEYGTTFSGITPATISVTGTAVTPRKNYDGNTSAVVVDNGNIVGIIGSDQVILNTPVANYDTKEVGTSKTITVTYTLTGSDAGNYLTPQSAIFTDGEISKIKPRVNNTVVDYTKIYNGNTIAAVTDNGSLEGVIDPDVTVVATANYDNKNVGSRKNITITYTLQGPNAGNYQTPDSVVRNQVGEILQKDVTGTGAVVATQKAYDGNTDVNVLYNGVISGIIMPDSVSHSVVATFRDKNAGVNKTVDFAYSIFGPDANNYRLVNSGEITTSTIVPKNVNIIGAVVENVREYDGTTNCRTLSNGVIDSLCQGDLITVTAQATFDNKNVDSAKVITIDYILHGIDSINYIVTTQTILNNGQITPIQLAATGLVVDEWKTYDGNTTANILQSPQLINVIPGDVLYLSASADFDTPDAGRGKTIIANYTVWGTDCNNYYQIPATEYSNNGVIFDKVQTAADTTYGLDYKIVTDNLNYCGGEDATLLYVLEKGEPVEYRIEFSNAAKSAGFADTGWTTMPLDIVIHIPDSCEGGLYYATIQFRNEIQKRDGIENTTRDTFAIVVNMSNRYIVDIFDDVVSIDNRENLFHSYQWYKEGQELAGANLPYYQDLGGLEGEYYVVVNIGEPTEAVICSKTFHHRVAQTSKIISAYPNPAESDLYIKLTGFSDGLHQLMMVNASGYIVVNEKFYGDTYQINVGSLPSGTYTVFVDGVSVKAVKK